MCRKIFCLVIPLLLFWGCERSLTEDAGNYSPLQRKAVNSPVNADAKSLLLYLGEDADGSAALESALKDAGARFFGRVFPEAGENEEKTRRAGLHRWHLVEFEDNVDIVGVAESFAELSEVCRIEFNSSSKLASDRLSRQYIPASASASSGSSGFNDPMLADQWHYSNSGDTRFAATAVSGADVNVTDAWKLIAGGSGIVVAVIDEAVQYNHPDLAANMWVNSDEIPNNGQDDDNNGYVDDVYGYNFVGKTGDLIWDRFGDSGHGTHVAGVVAAVNNNGEGICGIAGGTGASDGVRIMSCQIFSGGASSLSSEANAIKYAADNGAHIIQCSWGVPSGTYSSDREYKRANGIILDAIDYFVAKGNDVLGGGLPVFASGNEGKNLAGYPAAYSKCISVTAFAADYLPAYYTNYDKGCNISAPGGEYYTGGILNDKGLILSTMPTVALHIVDDEGKDTGEMSAVNYGYMKGTSMACPHVSGVAALGLAYAKKLGKTFTQDEFTSMLLTSVNEMDSRFNGEKTSITNNRVGAWSVAPYRKKMGTGSIDAWQLLMQIEGTPCLFAKVGEEQRLSIEQYMGESALTITYLGVEIDDEGMEALGLSAAPEIRYGKLKILPTKAGSAKMTVRAIAGGESLGDEDNPGGTEISKEISVVARTVSSKNGGWL